MKHLSKLAALVTSFSVLSLVAFTALPAFADSPGQLEGGSITYEVQDMTQNTSYSPSVNANACDELQYSVRLHNTSYGGFSDVNVQVSLPSTSSTTNTSTFTATTDLGGTTGTSGSATVNLSSAQSISYESGSAVLYGSNGNVIENLPSTLFSSGADIGGLNGSTTEFVNFKAKVNCPAPAPQPTYACTGLSIAGSGADNTIKITNFTTSQANGATFANATINWGDNTTALTTSQPVSQTHQYASAGTYTVTATANFSVNGATKSATSASCTQQAVISAVTPPTTTPPSQLVNTGPGNIIGAFLGVGALGTAGYSLFMRRKLAHSK